MMAVALSMMNVVYVAVKALSPARAIAREPHQPKDTIVLENASPTSITTVCVMHSILALVNWMLAAFATVPVRFTSAVAQTHLKAIAIAMEMNWMLQVFAEGLVQPMRKPMVFAMM
jgi:hypothetical protein